MKRRISLIKNKSNFLNFRQYDQDFFKEMHEETGVDLENIVYYKDEVLYRSIFFRLHCSFLTLGSLFCDDSKEGKLASYWGSDGRYS